MHTPASGWLWMSVLVLVVLGVVPLATTQAFPVPPIVTRSWELSFSHGDPRPIAVQDIDGKYHWYWYMPYKVTNRTGSERLFVPDFTIATDTGEIFQANRNIPSNVFKAIREYLDNPLLESPAQVVGQLLQGADHARESVVIWRDPDEDVGRISLFIAGLSGETTVIQNPATGQEVLMTRTLMIDYDMPGRPALPQKQALIKSGEKWIMR